MNQNISQLLFMAGAKYRNPSLWKEYNRLKQSEWLSRGQLVKLQIERARKFFEFAGEYSPYYKRIFRQHDFSASNFESINDLKKLPLLTKSQLIENNSELHADFKFNHLFLSATSGTTGTGLEFKKNEKWDSINRATMLRSYDWYNVKPWERYGYLWGYDISHQQATRIKLLDMSQNRFRMFSYDRQEMKSFSKKLISANFMAGYSSMIYEVAKTINIYGLDRPVLKMVKGTSEMILDVYQDAVKEAFGCKIISEYGAAESGLIAFECPKGNMHINIEDVIVEVDEEGEIVVTNLSSYSFPIIRYRLGDAVILSDELCCCGRAHPVLKQVIGRKGATVVGRNKTFPALTFYYVFKNIAMTKTVALNYKAIQKNKGCVDIYIEGINNSRYENDIIDELVKYFKKDIQFKLIFVKEFDQRQSKFQYFESQLSV